MREYLAHNSRVQPEARESEELSMTDISAQPRCLIGNEVRHSKRRVPRHHKQNIHFGAMVGAS